MTVRPEDSSEIATTESARSSSDGLSPLPPGWTRATLGELVSTKSGNSKLIKGKLAASPSEGLVPAYSASGQDVWTSAAEWHVDGVVLSAVGARCGKTFLARNSWTAIANTHVLIPKEGVDPRWLWYLTNDESFWIKGGTAQPFVKMGASKSIPLLLPPIEEQRRIAAVLDGAEALRAKRRQAIAKLDDLTEAVFHDMFGAPAAESEWPKVSLVDVCQRKGEYGANVPAVDFDGETPRYLRITDIRTDGTLTDEAVGPGGTEGQWRSKILKPGDILFARSGATVGKSFLVRKQDPPLVFAGYLVRFIPDEQRVLPEFMYQCTKTERYRSWVAGAATTVAQPNINASKYGQFELSLPPMDLQRDFVDAVERIRRHRVALDASSSVLDVLFASLQQRAFRGEL